MKTPLLLVSILFLAGCSHSSPDVTYVNPTPVAGSTIASNSTESVRTQDVIKAYPNGRYIDPHDGNVMYGQGVAYQVQQSANWNLNNNDPVHVPLGPVTEYTTPAGDARVTSPELAQKLREQEAIVKIVTSQNDRLMSELDKLRQALTEAQADKVKLAELESQIKTLQDEKAKTDQISSQKALPNPQPAKKSWWSFGQ